MENKYTNAVDFFQSRSKGRLPIASELILAAYELRTPENLGAIIRLAGNLGVVKVIFIQTENIFKDKKIARVAHSSFKHIDFSFCKPDEFHSKIPADFELVAVETAGNASNIYQTALPAKCVLLVGNERYGIAQNLLDCVSKTVFIPLKGKTLSMNVSHATAIAAFEWGRQHLGLNEMK